MPVREVETKTRDLKFSPGSVPASALRPVTREARPTTEDLGSTAKDGKEHTEQEPGMPLALCRPQDCKEFYSPTGRGRGQHARVLITAQLALAGGASTNGFLLELDGLILPQGADPLLRAVRSPETQAFGQESPLLLHSVEERRTNSRDQRPPGQGVWVRPGLGEGSPATGQLGRFFRQPQRPGARRGLAQAQKGPSSPSLVPGEKGLHCPSPSVPHLRVGSSAGLVRTRSPAGHAVQSLRTWPGALGPVLQRKQETWALSTGKGPIWFQRLNIQLKCRDSATCGCSQAGPWHGPALTQCHRPWTRQR
ncbi:hypothetical protein H920_03319 [Fukomys damarensis]|uniref:Uncharacterized protein n=1 Tax=Fukomys damarensis TaxID=885580 RepID=A0A091DST3_FUKDA|nr:hypothetical protein H920_03319 [Fukomys damarensis]